jgi:hypothetical protein
MTDTRKSAQSTTGNASKRAHQLCLLATRRYDASFDHAKGTTRNE